MEKRIPKIKEVLDIYSKIWARQQEVFSQIREINPYVKPEIIDIGKFSDNEKSFLSKLDLSVEEDVFRQTGELLIKKFGEINQKTATFDETRSKLKFEVVTEIPTKECVSLDRFYYSIPTGIVKPHITKDELKWFYIKGFLPHLYWNNGEPMFDKRMWFIVVFEIKRLRNNVGLGIFKNFSESHPEWVYTVNYLNLVKFMYNSWRLGETIMDYADKKIRNSGYKDEDFKIARRALTRSLWINEGSVIASHLIKNSNLISNGVNALEYYRDVFALMSFESFPGNHLIDLYHNPSQRLAVMMTYEPLMKLRTYDMGFLNIDTRSDHRLSDNYGSLFYAMDWALSMNDKVYNRDATDIINRYRQNDLSDKGKVPCRICAELFMPKRRIDITCGKKECIIKNKYLSKQKNIKLELTPLG